MHHLLHRYPIITEQISQPALGVILGELEKVLKYDVAGDTVEFGCYIGTTSLFIRRLLDQYELLSSSRHDFHVYDSFAGLPAKTPPDYSAAGVEFQAGELAVSKKQFLTAFRRSKLLPPITHKAWFSDLAADDVPAHINFAFLDSDFYESIKESLQLVWPRLSPGGVITVDDFQRAALPGVERAVSDFFRDKPVSYHHQHNIAIITRVP